MEFAYQNNIKVAKLKVIEYGTEGVIKFLNKEPCIKDGLFDIVLKDSIIVNCSIGIPTSKARLEKEYAFESEGIQG